MRPAAADQRIELGLDLVIGRMRIAFQISRRRHDPAIDAIGALRDLLLEPCGLQGMRMLRRPQAGERGDLAFRCSRDRDHAGTNRGAVQVNGAGATLSEPAAEARVVQLQLVTKRIEQRHARVVDLDCMRLAVDLEGKPLRHDRLRAASQIINPTARCGIGLNLGLPLVRGLTRMPEELGAMRITAIILAILAFDAGMGPAHAAEPQPLVLEATIALPDTPGRIDHIAVDLNRKRLFIAEVGNNTLDVVDLTQQKPVRRISGLNEPQGVAYLPGPDLFVVANGGDGAVRFYGGNDFAPRGVLNLGDDADNVRVDPRNGQVLAGYGDGGLAVIDPVKPAKLADIPLAAHPESFRLSPSTGRVFVNLPGGGRIAGVDLDSRKVIAEWRTPGL